MRLSNFAVASCTLVLVSGLGAQTPLDVALGTLKAGDSVRIRVRGGDRIESRIVSVRTEPLGLQLMGAGTAVDAAAIDSLWVRGRATQTGTNSGALVGGALSFGFWAAVCSGLSEGQGCSAWGTVAALTLAGALGGAIIGAAIGALVPNWKLRYAPAAPVQGTLKLRPKHGLGIGVAYTVGW